MSKRRSLFVALSGAFAAVLGALWFRQRRTPTEAPVEVLPIDSPTPQVVQVEASLSVIPQWVVLTLRLVSAVLGLASLTQMQALLLASRLPFAPLGLFVLGIALLLPLVANPPTQDSLSIPLPAYDETAPNPSNRMRRAFYFAACVFFVIVSLVVSQFGAVALLLWLTWLLGIIAIF